MRSNPPIKVQSLYFPIRLTFQYAFLCHFAEVYSANAHKFPIIKPIASISNTHSLVTSQKSIPPMRSDSQLKTNRFHSQYAFLCHFAEVYSANALKSPIKDQSLHFPIRTPLSLRRSLFSQCVQIHR
jgi:hypothetical protein